MKWEFIFNKHRWYALGLMVVAAVIGWFSLVLVTDPVEEGLQISPLQWIGLGFAIFIGIVAWIRNCLTVKPYKNSN